MVIAGISIRKMSGDNLKKGIKLASSNSRIFVSPLISQRNNQFKVRNMNIKIYPIIELKKLRNSLKYNAFII
jgi:hypothetical protein